MVIDADLMEAIDEAITAGACWRAARADRTRRETWERLAAAHHGRSDEALKRMLRRPDAADVRPLVSEDNADRDQHGSGCDLVDLPTPRGQVGLQGGQRLHCDRQATNSHIPTIVNLVERLSVVEEPRRERGPANSAGFRKGLAARKKVDQRSGRLGHTPHFLGILPDLSRRDCPDRSAISILGDPPDMAKRVKRAASQDVLARRIQERLDVLGLNAFAAAKKAGLAPDTVRDVLRGKVKTPGADKLAKLALALETTLYFLLGIDEMEIQVLSSASRPSADPDALGPTPFSLDKQAVLLPIKHELIYDTWKRAAEVDRPPLGYEAATIPAAYAGREVWWEVLADETMSEIAPLGCLVQVVEWDDKDRANLNHGEFIIVEKRLVDNTGKFGLVERTMRLITKRYHDLDLWFLDFMPADPDAFRETDDILKESSDAREYKPYSEPKILPSLDRNSFIFLPPGPIVVGKAIRVLMPVSKDADFGLARLKFG